ncbi:MAG: glyoxalase/bleomycin resistance protein/dioxygenase [Bacteroidota bacterium]|jgi:predicted lactoylglutathione lyase|nr:glyoxalase/bleomycin resistance protein/dioxygenase [Bacteroidota bacterium]
MAKTKLFLNLPVKDLDRSMTFFKKLGYSFNPQFTNENATSMIISEDINVMLLVGKFFKGFMKKEICDTSKSCEAIMAITAESKEAVDKIIKTAVEAGATLYSEPLDHGWMYQHAFQDLDGHLWEYFYMDPNGPPKS